MGLARDCDAGIAGTEMWQQLTQPPLRVRLGEGRLELWKKAKRSLPDG